MNGIQYESFGVYLVLLDEEYVFLPSSRLPFSLGKKGENPQKCALRMKRELMGDGEGRLVSLPYVGRMDKDLFPSSITSLWAPGIKTIPVYGFKMEGERKERDWIQLDQARKMVEKAEKDVLFFI